MMKSCLLWLNLFADLLRFLILTLRAKRSFAARESLPAQTARVLPGTQNQAPPDFPFNALDPPVAQPLVRLAKRVDGRDAQNLHRLAPQGFELFRRRKCQSGRSRLPPDLQRLIRRMAHENPSWGEERIANELGMRVSPRTIRKYLPKLPSAPVSNPRGDQR